MTPWTGSAQRCVWRNLCEWASGKNIFSGPIDVAWKCMDKNVKLRDKRGREDTEALCDWWGVELLHHTWRTVFYAAVYTWASASSTEVNTRCFPELLSPYYLSQSSHWTESFWPSSSKDLPVSTFPTLGLQAQAAMPGFMCIWIQVFIFLWRALY